MYIKTSNGAYEKPYSIGQLRKDNPNTSFPKNPSEALLAEWGVFPVTPTPQPAYDPATEKVIDDAPVYVEGAWQQTWQVVPLNDQEKAERQNAAREQLKNTGIEINGVLCSATRNDQDGLTAVAMGVTLARMAGEVFPPTVFYFENGSSMVITDDNFDSIYSQWVPFRQSFFAA
jgi:hypothetical protein